MSDHPLQPSQELGQAPQYLVDAVRAHTPDSQARAPHWNRLDAERALLEAGELGNEERADEARRVLRQEDFHD
jgi:hypothetical protein